MEPFEGCSCLKHDVDFWLSTEKENLQKLIKVFKTLGYDIDSFPEEIKKQQQNISIKFSPHDLNVELIINFNINKTFDEAYQSAEQVAIEKTSVWKYYVLSYEDLIISKIKSNRPKDLLDIQELQRINKNR